MICNKKDVDGRDKPGHDGEGRSTSAEHALARDRVALRGRGSNRRVFALVRPRRAPAVGKIVGIRDGAARRLLGLEHLARDAMALAVSDRLLLAVEPQSNSAASCRSSWSIPSAVRRSAALPARIPGPIPSCSRSPTASRCGPAYRRVQSWRSARGLKWSGQQDLNLRPGVPKTPALPGCAMPRRSLSKFRQRRYTLPPGPATGRHSVMPGEQSLQRLQALTRASSPLRVRSSCEGWIAGASRQ